jgi:hypothetical protein
MVVVEEDDYVLPPDVYHPVIMTGGNVIEGECRDYRA